MFRCFGEKASWARLTCFGHVQRRNSKIYRYEEDEVGTARQEAKRKI